MAIEVKIASSEANYVVYKSMLLFKHSPYPIVFFLSA